MISTRGQVARRLGGEAHREHRSDREVRGVEDRDAGLPRRRVEARTAGRVDAGRPEHERDAPGQARADDRASSRSGRVKSQTTSTARRVERLLEVAEGPSPAPRRLGAMRATSSRSSAAATPSATGRPVRPVAPATATRRVTPPAGASDRPRRRRRRTRPRRGRCRRPRGARAPTAAVRATAICSGVTASTRRETSSGSRISVPESRFLPSRDMRDDARLERQQHAAREVPLRALELARAQVAGSQRRGLVAHDREALLEVLRTRPDVHADLAALGVRRVVRSRPSTPCPGARGSPGRAATRPCRRASRRAARARSDRRPRGRARDRRRRRGTARSP